MSIQETEGVGGVKRPGANYMHSDARMNTEAKMAAEIAANKAKANNAQNTGAGTSTNQTDYNKKASDEISVGATNMDGTSVVGNNIRTGDQTSFGGQDGSGTDGGGSSDHVAAVKLATMNFEKELSFEAKFKEKFGGDIGIAKSITNQLASNPDGVKDLKTNKESFDNIANALSNIHEQDGKAGLLEVNKNIQKNKH